MTELLERRLSGSLDQVEAALARWRAGDIGAFEAHAAVLEHAARAERLAARMARVGFDTAGSLLRDAFDDGLIDRAEFCELMGCAPEDVPPSPPLDAGGRGGELPAKRAVVEELLAEGAVLVHVDASAPGVRVPERFAGDAKLVLRFGYNLSPPVPDLEVDDAGLRGTLTFGGVPHRCELPWPAVYAVVSDVDSRGLVWPDDVPDDVLGDLAGRADDGDGGDDGARGDGAPAGGAASRPRKGAHLRLVK